MTFKGATSTDATLTTFFDARTVCRARALGRNSDLTLSNWFGVA